MGHGSSVPLPANLEAQGVPVTLREYFQKEYKSGGVFRHDGYCDDDDDADDDDEWCWRHKSTNIKVWRDAIDLSSTGSGALECVFHYTSEIGFRNITNRQKKAAEIFASLITEGDKANAWWGKGVYTVRKAPDEWPNVQTLLDNNFRNMLKRDIEKKGLEVATEEYRARVAYCIPILSRSSINIDVSVSQTPEMLAQDKPPGINLAGKTLDGRQCIVVRIEEENQVANASAVLVETLHQRARVASERFGPQTEESLRADFRLGDVLHDRGAYGEAEPLLRTLHESTVASLGPKHRHTLSSMNHLAVLLESQGKFTEAEPIFRKALEGYEATLGPNHPSTLTSVNDLAALQCSQGKFAEAEALYRRALEGNGATLGPNHPSTLTSVNNLAFLLHSQGNFTEAEPLLRRALEGNKATLGPNHPSTLTSVNNLAVLLKSQGNFTDAEPLLRTLHESTVASLGPNHPNTLSSMNNLAGLLHSQGNFTEAEPLYRRALEGKEATLGPKHPSTLASIFSLGKFLEQKGALDEAEQLYIRELHGIQALHGKEHDETVASRKNLERLRRLLKTRQ